MKVILKEDHEKLGKASDVIEVKDGYARNFLIPQGLAVMATKKNMQLLEEERKQEDRRASKEKLEAEARAEGLSNVSLTIPVAVGEEDRLFGSVTSQTIADHLKEKGYDIDKRKIMLEEPIKALGIYTVSVKLHANVNADVRVWVVKE